MFIAADAERAKLDKLRGDRESVAAEVESIALAPLPLDEAVARALASFAEPIARVDLAMRQCALAGGMPTLESEGAALLAWLDPQAFERSLRKRLGETMKAAGLIPGLPSARRPAAIAKLQERLAALAELEEREVCAIEARGFVVDRRTDVDPALLLRVWDSLPLP